VASLQEHQVAVLAVGKHELAARVANFVIEHEPDDVLRSALRDEGAAGDDFLQLFLAILILRDCHGRWRRADEEACAGRA
jgi:hypothetical protein